jgi:hypothetical protein
VKALPRIRYGLTTIICARYIVLQIPGSLIDGRHYEMYVLAEALRP